MSPSCLWHGSVTSPTLVLLPVPALCSMATGALLVTAVRLQRTGEPGAFMAPSLIICQKLGFPEGGLSSCQLHLSMPSVGVGESQSVLQMLVIRTEMWLRRWSWEACFAPASSLLVNCAALFLRLRKGAATELTWNSQPGLCRHGQGTAETQGCPHLQGISSL